jgi:hypothetical protein
MKLIKTKTFLLLRLMSSVVFTFPTLATCSTRMNHTSTTSVEFQTRGSKTYVVQDVSMLGENITSDLGPI